MPPKRTRRSSLGPSGLSAGERLKRAKLTGNAAYSAWGWVGTEVADASGITRDHHLVTCGLSWSSTHTLCRNKYAEKRQTPPGDIPNGSSGPADPDEATDDVIVISDDEGPTCSNRACKSNPYCVNYLGQDKWEDVGEPCLALCVRLISDSGRRQSLRGVCESTRPREQPRSRFERWINANRSEGLFILDGKPLGGLHILISPVESGSYLLCECVLAGKII